jgi:hypothetical protein
MRNGEGGTVPSYNVQLLTDVTHGLGELPLREGV